MSTSVIMPNVLGQLHNCHTRGSTFGVTCFIIQIVTQTTPMRKIEEQMNMAIRARKSWAGSNTTVRAYNDSIDVYLHGHCIAWLDVINDVWTLSSCGWETNTTKSRLNAIMLMNLVWVVSSKRTGSGSTQKMVKQFHSLME